MSIETKLEEMYCAHLDDLDKISDGSDRCTPRYYEQLGKVEILKFLYEKFCKKDTSD